MSTTTIADSEARQEYIKGKVEEYRKRGDALNFRDISVLRKENSCKSWQLYLGGIILITMAIAAIALIIIASLGMLA